MSHRKELQEFRKESLKEVSERLRGVTPEETLEQGLEFTQFALEVYQIGENKGDG